jgi:hypothetical protein
MKAPNIADFRMGPPPGEFSSWLIGLPPGVVTRVPARFKDIPNKNVSGSNAAVRTAGVRPHFRTVGGVRYVYTERAAQ